MALTKDSEIPEKINELRKILGDLAYSELYFSHPDVNVRISANDALSDLCDSIDKFHSIFNNSLL